MLLRCVAPQREELKNLGISVETNVDITSDESVADLVKRLDGKSIDVLINNAAIVERISLPQLDTNSIRRQFEVNALGPLRLTQALLPNLKLGSKVIMMTRRMGSIEDNTSGNSLVF